MNLLVLSSLKERFPRGQSSFLSHDYYSSGNKNFFDNQHGNKSTVTVVQWTQPSNGVSGGPPSQGRTPHFYDL